MNPPLSWHPMWMTLSLLALLVIPIPDDGWLLGAALGIAGAFLWLAWAYKARIAVAPIETGRRYLLYTTPIICMIAVVVARSTLPIEQRVDGSRMLGPTSIAELFALLTAVLAVGTYFAALWATAHAIERAEADQPTMNTMRTIGTFLSLAILPVSVWWLRPRVQRLIRAGPAKDRSSV